MNLLGALLLVLWGMYVYPGDISNIPLAQLTLAKLGDVVFSGALFAGAAYLGFESLLKDRIWPWRWTWRYVASLLIKAILCSSAVWLCLYVVIPHYQLHGWLAWLALGMAGTAILGTITLDPDELVGSGKAPTADEAP